MGVAKVLIDYYDVNKDTLGHNFNELLNYELNNVFYDCGRFTGSTIDWLKYINGSFEDYNDKLLDKLKSMKELKIKLFSGNYENYYWLQQTADSKCFINSNSGLPWDFTISLSDMKVIISRDSRFTDIYSKASDYRFLNLQYTVNWDSIIDVRKTRISNINDIKFKLVYNTAIVNRTTRTTYGWETEPPIDIPFLAAHQFVTNSKLVKF